MRSNIKRLYMVYYDSIYTCIRLIVLYNLYITERRMKTIVLEIK